MPSIAKTGPTTAAGSSHEHRGHAGDRAVFEVWRELIDFLVEKEGISRADAERKCIWVTSGIPSGARDKARGRGGCFVPRSPWTARKSGGRRTWRSWPRWIGPAPRSSGSLPSRCSPRAGTSRTSSRSSRTNRARSTPTADRPGARPWAACSCWGLTGSRSSPSTTTRGWSGEIANLLKDILEVENTLSWGYEPSRAQYTFPPPILYATSRNRPLSRSNEKQRVKPQVTFQPQATTEYSRFSETGAGGRDQSSRPLRPRRRRGRDAAVHPGEGRGVGARLDEGAAAGIHRRPGWKPAVTTPPS